MNSKKADAMLLCAAAIGGTGFIGMKALLDSGFSVFQAITGRFFVAAVIMSVIFYKKCRRLSKKDWYAGSIMGVFLFGVFYFMTVGLQYTTPSINAFFTNTPAVIVPFIVWAAYKKSPGPIVFVAAFIAVLGIFMISVDSGFHIQPGAFLSLAASFCYAIQMVVTARFSKQRDPFHIAMVQYYVVFVLSAICSVFGENTLPEMTLKTGGIFVFIGFFCTGVCFLFQTVAQKYTTASKTAILISSEAVFTLLFSVILVGEDINVYKITGCILLFLAILLAETKTGFIIKNGAKQNINY